MSAKIFSIYVNNMPSSKRTDENIAKLKEAFDTDKELTASEALELGLIDEIVDSMKVAAIYSTNNIKMENKETKTLLDDLKAWFEGKFAPKNEAPETETPEQLKEKITALENELNTLKAEKEAKDAEVVTLTAQVETLNSLKSDFENKIKEIDNKIIGAENPDNKKDEGKELPKPETVAERMKRLDAENRKKYNQN